MVRPEVCGMLLSTVSRQGVLVMSMLTRFIVIAVGLTTMAVLAAGCAEQLAPTGPTYGSPSALGSPDPSSDPSSGPWPVQSFEPVEPPTAAPDYAVPTRPIPPVVPNGQSPLAGAPPATGATDPGLGPEAALAQALAGMSHGNVSADSVSTVILKAQIAASPPGSQYPSGPWFYATVACPDPGRGHCIEQSWEADILQGATAELMNRTQVNLANVLVGGTLRLRLPDGRLTDPGSGMGQEAAFQQFRRADATDTQIISQIDTIVRKDGLRPASVDVYRPDGPAVAVVVDMPATGMPHGVTLNSLEHDLNGSNIAENYSGMYLQLNTADGTPIGETAGSGRDGANRSWYEPRYYSIMGILHGGAAQGGLGHAHR